MSDITVKNFSAKAKSVTLMGVKANNLAHALGVFALQHALDHGDVRQADTIYNAMKAGHLRAEGFRVWVETFSPIYWNGDGKIGLMKPTAKKYVNFNVEAANEKPFWTLEAANERAVKELSIEALTAMLQKALKDAESADDKGEVFDKNGELKAVVKGNVIQVKKFASAVRAAIVSATPINADATAPAVEEVANRIAA